VPRQQSQNWWRSCPWTLALVALMGMANLGLVASGWDPARAVVGCFQFDRQAILHGELWRLVTANFVHWSIEHFLLDAGAFLLVGLLYERHFGRSYPWMLLACGLAVGCGVFAMVPEMATYRGLSGVDSGQFAAALCVEADLARRDRSRWLWLTPVAAIFAAKILWEITTGQMFFGTESLGDIGLPVPVAHAVGTATAVAFVAVQRVVPLQLPRTTRWEPECL